MIKSFIFEDFKGFRRSVLDIETITTLVGPNGSGKSNVIEGIKILSELASGRDINMILDGTKAVEGNVRGGSRGCCRFNGASFLLGCSVAYDDDFDLLYQIRINTLGSVNVEKESLYLVEKGSNYDLPGILVFEAKFNSETKRMDVKYSGITKVRNSKCKSSRKFNLTNTDVDAVRRENLKCEALSFIAVLSQIPSHISDRIANYDKIVSQVWLIQKDLTNIIFYSPKPSVMVHYNQIEDSSLAENCYNVSSVLYRIKSEQPKDWEVFCNILKSLSDYDFEDIKFVDTPLNDVIMYQVEKHNDGLYDVDISMFSDGYLRCIAVLAAMLSEAENRVLVFEDFDRNIYTGKMKIFMSAIQKIVKQRNIELIIVTHNVALLNTFEKEEIMGVSLFYYNSAISSSDITPFIEMENSSGLLAMGRLGDILESGKLNISK